MNMMDQVTNDQIADSKWRSLYQVGGWGALIVGTLFIIEMIVYIASSAPSLADAPGWLMLFQKNRLLGLVDFGILEFYGLVLFVPMFLALYVALKRASESYMMIAAILAFVGIAVNLATSKLFSLLSLSDLYAAATTDALRSQFLVAAQAALAQSAQGGISGGVEGGIPLAVAGLVISFVMLRSKIFGKASAYVGVLANGIGLVMYISAAAGPAFGGSPFFVLFFLLSVIWFFLIARRFFQLGQTTNGDVK
jgi:hypothetical protein